MYLWGGGGRDQIQVKIGYKEIKLLKAATKLIFDNSCTHIHSLGESGSVYGYLFFTECNKN